jgi:hypothetical protein
MSHKHPTQARDLHMTVVVSPVLVPYAEFLERRARRHGAAPEGRRQDVAPTIDAESVAVAVAKPIGPGQRYPRRVKNAEA